MSVRLCSAATLLGAVVALAAPAPADAGFSVVSSPSAFGQSVLNGVSASSASDAWAVGSLCCSGSRFGSGTLTEHWNGGGWTIAPSPDTRLNDEVLNAVVDLSPTNVWAVGQVKQSGFKSGNPLTLRWDGLGWRTVAPPTGLTGKLRAVSGDGAIGIWAVGDDDHGKAVVVRCVAASCVRAAAPHVGFADRLRGVKAFGPADAWAVGDQTPSDTSNTVSTLVLHWNGAAWSVVPSPNPDPRSDILHAVGGASGGDVWAVGQKTQDTGTTGVLPGTRTLALHWNGASWRAVSTPNVGYQDTLGGIAVSGAATAVGSFQDVTTGALRTLALRWNGSAWTRIATPNVGAADNLLRAASPIPGTSAGWAVGLWMSSSGPIRTLVLRGP